MRINANDVDHMRRLSHR